MSEALDEATSYLKAAIELLEETLASVRPAAPVGGVTWASI
jgi:hypothetical protein